MAFLIYSGLLLITGVQIKAFNEASDEVLTSWRPPGARGDRQRLAGALSVYSYSPVMKCLYAEAWSPCRKNRLKMMSSSKSFLALSFHLMPGASCPIVPAPEIAPDLLSRTDRCNFYDLIAFLPW